MLPEVPPQLFPFIITGFAMLALAAWLMVLDAGSPLNRAFALILAFRGGSTLAAMGRAIWAPVDRAAVAGFFALAVVLTIPIAAAILYFLSVYPRRRGFIGTHPAGPWLLVAVTTVALGWFMVDHTAYFSFVVAEDGVRRVNGPLFVFGSLVAPALATAAFVLARDYRKRPHGSQGYSTFLIAAGFAINALVDGTAWAVSTLHAYGTGGWAGLQQEALPSGVLYAVGAMLALPIGLAALLEMSRAIRHERQDQTLQEARRFITVVAPIAILSSIGAGVAGIQGRQEVYDFIQGFWRLAVPAVITYSLLRFSLFDADIRLKAGVRRTIVMAAFTITFFIVSEAAEAVLQGERGPVVGILGAAFIALAARPMHSVARRAADALMPDTLPVAAMSPRERQVLYHDQFMLVHQDRKLTAKERRMLDHLAASLGLRDDEASSLETDRPSFTEDDRRPAVMTEDTYRPGLGVRLSVAGLTALTFGAVSQSLEFVVSITAPLQAVGIGDTAVGLLSAAAIALLLRPIEDLVKRMAGAGSRRAIDPETLEVYRDAFAEVIADGDLSRRDRIYLHGLADRLGIDAATRRFVDGLARQEHGMPRRRPWAT